MCLVIQTARYVDLHALLHEQFTTWELTSPLQHVPHHLPHLLLHTHCFPMHYFSSCSMPRQTWGMVVVTGGMRVAGRQRDLSRQCQAWRRRDDDLHDGWQGRWQQQRQATAASVVARREEQGVSKDEQTWQASMATPAFISSLTVSAMSSQPPFSEQKAIPHCQNTLPALWLCSMLLPAPISASTACSPSAS